MSTPPINGNEILIARVHSVLRTGQRHLRRASTCSIWVGDVPTETFVAEVEGSEEEEVMDEIGVGVVGCGFVGRGAHVPSLEHIDGARLAAVADADATRRNKAASKHGAEASYADYHALIDDPNVDAVIVALPTPLHVPASIAALEAGKHVICEMPLATNLEDADRLVEAARTACGILMPSLTFRFTSNYVKAKAMIAQGAVGAPTSVLYREFIPAADLAAQWPADCWMWRIGESGGPLFTLSVWSIDLVRWLFDTEITDVRPVVKYTPLEKTSGTLGYDANVALRLANGMVGCLQYSGSVNRAASKSNLEVVGDATNVLCASDNDRVILLGEQPERTEWNVKESGPRMWGHEQQNAYFIRCIREGRKPEITPEDGRRAMQIALQIVEATAETVRA